MCLILKRWASARILKNKSIILHTYYIYSYILAIEVPAQKYETAGRLQRDDLKNFIDKNKI